MSETYPRLLELTRNVVCSFVANNFIAHDEIPDLIEAVHISLADIMGAETANAIPKEQKPAVPIIHSVTPDYIICLEDGQKFKSLRRHLRVKFNLSPEQYRAKWGLPRDYPLVAPNYAVVRSRIAKQTVSELTS